MPWSRTWKLVTLGVALAAASAAGVTVYLHQSTSARPFLAGLDNGSRAYLARHAQGWLTCPAAASKCWRWKMQESNCAVAIVDDLSGDAETLTPQNAPVCNLLATIPMSDGFTRRQWWYRGGPGGLTDYHRSLGDPTLADFATGNFSGTAWVFVPPGTHDGIIAGKRLAGGGPGWYWYLTGTHEIAIYIRDAAGVAVAATVTPVLYPGWHMVTAVWDRAGNRLRGYVDGVNTTLTGDITAVTGSITNAVDLAVGAMDGGDPLLGGISELLLANGVTTLAEHQAAFKAFLKPTEVSGYNAGTTSTRNPKWPLPPDALGERLLDIGYTTLTWASGVWPTTYRAALVSTENPLGLGYPVSGTKTNSIGYPNQFDSWTTSGAPVVTANDREAPDGSYTADTLVVDAAEGIYKTAVGAAVWQSYERRCASFYARKISGDCTTLQFDVGIPALGGSAYPVLASTWTRHSACRDGNGVSVDGFYLLRGDGTNCTVALADAQWEVGDVSPPITSCYGDVTCLRYQSFYSHNWQAKASLAPATLTRGEIEVTAVLDDAYYRSNWTRGLAGVARSHYVADGEQPSFVWRNQGHVEAVARGKPKVVTGRRRKYVGSWDTDATAGLPNTSPRLYAALEVDGYRSAVTAAARPHNASGQVPTTSLVPAWEAPTGGYTMYVGYESGGYQSTDGVIESAYLYARPAQKVYSAEPSHVVSADFTGPAYLATQAVPPFTCPVGGTCSIYGLTEWSGDLLDQNGANALSPSGTPIYHSWTGLLARGRGRRGWFYPGRWSAAYSYSTNATLISLTTADTRTLEAVITMPHQIETGGTAAEYRRIAGVTNAGSWPGYAMYLHNAGRPACMTLGDAGAPRHVYGTAPLEAGGTYHLACVYEWGGATWNSPLLYVNGVVPATGTAGALHAGDMTGTQFRVGYADTGGDTWWGGIHEVRLSDNVRTQPELLAAYRTMVTTGDWLPDDAHVLGHWRMNGSQAYGPSDSSGNNRHLTVSGSGIVARAVDMPWPAGSGLSRKAIAADGVNDYWTAASDTVADKASQNFSVHFWMRRRAAGSGGCSYDRIVSKRVAGGNGAGYEVLLGNMASAGQLGIYFADGVSNVTAAFAGWTADDKWHLVSVGFVRGDKAYLRVDGAAVADIDISTVAGSATNAGLLTVADYSPAPPVCTPDIQLAGLMIADGGTDLAFHQAQGANFDDSPLPNLTYTRAGEVCHPAAAAANDGARVRCWGPNQVPFAYGLTQVAGNEVLGLGLPVYEAETNWLPYSSAIQPAEIFPGTIVTSNAALSPAGTITADNVQHPTNQPGIFKTSVNTGAVLTGRTFVGSCYLRTLPPYTGSSLCLGLNDGLAWANGSGALYAVNPFWTRYSVTHTFPATVSTQVRVQTDTDNISLLGAAGNCNVVSPQNVYDIWGCEVVEVTAGNPDTGDLVHCPTAAGSATCAAATPYLPAAQLASWTGEEATIASTSLSGTMYAASFSMNNGIDMAGSVWSFPWWGYIRSLDNTGATAQEVNRVAVPTSYTSPQANVFAWDNGADFYGTRQLWGATHRTQAAGVSDTYITDVGNWNASAGVNLYLGYRGGGARLNGILGTVSVYNTRN